VEFWDKIRDVRAQDLIFIDESGVNRVFWVCGVNCIIYELYAGGYAHGFSS